MWWIIHRLSWLDKKQKRSSTNEKDNKCFQHAVGATLSHEETGKMLEKTTKTKPCINKYKWEGISFPSEKDDWKKN